MLARRLVDRVAMWRGNGVEGANALVVPRSMTVSDVEYFMVVVISMGGSGSHVGVVSRRLKL